MSATPAPAPAKPAVDPKDKLFDDIHVVIDKLFPEVINGAKNGLKEELKRQVEKWETTIKNDAVGAIKEIQDKVTELGKSLKADKEAAAKLFLSSIDDWAKATGANTQVVKGLQLLGSEETWTFLKDLYKLWKDRKNGNKEITIRADKLIYGILSLVIGIVSLVVWIMQLASMI